MPIPFLPKSAEALRVEMKAFQAALGIGNIYEGGKAKAMFDEFANIMAELHGSTYDGIKNSNSTTATGPFLDLRANSLALTRVLAETDESLRNRIQIAQINRQACNDIAIDSRLKTHPRVQDVAYADFVYGSGSFATFIDPIANTQVDAELLNDIDTILAGVVAKGVMAPTMSVEMRGVRMVLLVRGVNLVPEVIAEAVRGYLESLRRAQTMAIDRVRAAAVGAGASGVEFKEIYLDQQPVLPRDIPAAWDEKIVPDPNVAEPIQVIT